jgi:hypothetical protein
MNVLALNQMSRLCWHWFPEFSERGLISDVVKMTFEAMLSGEPRPVVLRDVKESLNKIMEKEGARPMNNFHQLCHGAESIHVDQMQQEMRRNDGERSLVLSMAIEPEGDAFKTSPKGIVNDVTGEGTDDTRLRRLRSVVRPFEIGDVESRATSFPSISNASTWEEASQTEILSLNETLDSVCWEATVSQNI